MAGAIGQAFDRRVAAKTEILRSGRADRPAASLLAQLEQRAAMFLADRVIVMTRRPGTVREVIDVAPIRADERWDRFEHSEELMDQASFVHLRTRIWRLLRSEQQPDAEAALHPPEEA